ncbi:MAG: hypothetical protein JWO12_24 [Frankiales bacterium]|nr:hypothetical protein [Frankiales bacterium]
MSRRHADPVEVRTVAAPSGPVPDQFLWNGRRYVVREVLARWTESGSWWRGTGVRALMTGSAAVTSNAAVGIDDRETQWWRVEADSGRLAALSAGTGVYDLCFEESTARWSLKRVMD